MQKLGLKMVILVWIIAGLQIILGPLMVESIQNKKFKNISRLKTSLQQPVDGVFFSDSTNDFTAPTDTDKRSISGMVADLLPAEKFVLISHAAYQLDIYNAYCEFIVRRENRPRWMVIPINLRSFSPSWHYRPEYQFGEEKFLLREGLQLALYTPLAVFGFNFSGISQAEFLNSPVFLESEEMGKMASFQTKRRRQFDNRRAWREYVGAHQRDVIIMNYLYHLGAEHGKIQSLKKLADHLRRSDILPLFYITPLDYESAERYFPRHFRSVINEHVSLIQTILAEYGMLAVDCSLDLGSSYFAWHSQIYINEHLNQDGRAYLARRIAGEIECLQK